MEIKLENVSYLIEKKKNRSALISISKNVNIKQNKELLLQDINLNLDPGSVTVFVG